MDVPSKEEFNQLSMVVEHLKKEVERLLNEAPLPEWLTVQQAAERLKRVPVTVREMAKRGDLEYKQGKRKMEIRGESVRQYNLKHTIQ